MTYAETCGLVAEVVDPHSRYAENLFFILEKYGELPPHIRQELLRLQHRLRKKKVNSLVWGVIDVFTE